MGDSSGGRWIPGVGVASGAVVLESQMILSPVILDHDTPFHWRAQREKCGLP